MFYGGEESLSLPEFDKLIAFLEPREAVWLQLVSRHESPFDNDDDVDVFTLKQDYSCPIGQARETYLEHYPGSNICLDWIDSPRTDELLKSIECSVDPEMMGEFRPDRIAVTLGLHELAATPENDFEEEQWTHYGKAYVSISFWGYEVPNDWGAAREQLLALPMLSFWEDRLADCISPLKKCCKWEV